MALGWITAMKAIPWNDVIDAAPVIVKAARKYFARKPPDADPALDAGTDRSPEHAHARITALEARLVEMNEREQALAQLLESLAEQNAKVVQAVDVLRLRTRLLLLINVGLALALLGTWWRLAH